MNYYSREPAKRETAARPLCRYCAVEDHDSTEHSPLGCLQEVDRAYICGCLVKGGAGRRVKVVATRHRAGGGELR